MIEGWVSEADFETEPSAHGVLVQADGQAAFLSFILAVIQRFSAYLWMDECAQGGNTTKDFKYFHRHECKERPDSLGVSVDWMKIKTNCCNRVLLLDRFHDARHIYQTICKLKTLPVCFIGSWSIILAILPISSDVPCGEGVIPFLFFHHDEEVLQNTLKLIDNVECIYLG